MARASANCGESLNENSATSSRFVRATHWAALRPATTYTVVAGGTLAASRNKLVFRAPQSPLSVLMMISARFLTSRFSANGCWNSPAPAVAAAITSFMRVA